MTRTRSLHARLALRAAIAGLAGLAAWAPIPVADAATLTRYPWINILTPTSVTVAWQTDVPTTGVLEYSTDLFNYTTVNDGLVSTDHVVTLNSLTPDDLYFYRVTDGTDVLSSEEDYFIAPPTTTFPFQFIALGDLGAATADQIAIAARADSVVADLGILTGDIIYEAGEAANFTPQYFDIYRPTIARIPFYTALGNHDVGTSNGQPYLDAFHLPTNSATGTERYYSFDYSNAHFVCLEVVTENQALDATMLNWLDDDLAASTKLWKFVFFHVPAYSNGGGHGGDNTIAAALEPIFIAHGVDLVFQGHNHFYTRTYPLLGGVEQDVVDEPNYFNPSGPIWVTTGGGGRSLHALTALSSREASAVSTHHLVDVFVVENGLYLQAIAADGAVFDILQVVKSPTTAIAIAGFEAVGGPDGVRLRWTRADGGNDGGFHVERAASPAGPWTRLTPSLLVGGGAFEFVDESGEPGVTYAYRLALVDGQGRETASGVVSASRSGALRFALGRARPNPARGATSLHVTLEREAPTRVMVVDAQGRLVRTLASRPMAAGAHVLSWDGADDRGIAAAAGIYFAVVRSGGHEAKTRVALLR
ncbi:MAG TPA: metallophosphoesterase [Candidatus Eisenbacteria bacterium]|nr:metallophosphoesterase [Candidatus Eisenbacteria bacterium]